MSRRVLAGISVMALSFLSVAGCSQSDNNSEGKIEFQSGEKVDMASFQTLKELTDAYNATDPDVQVELHPAGTNNEEMLKVRLGANNPPDIFGTHGWSVARYSSFLVPLQNEEWAQYLSPALKNSMLNDEGELFALPTDVSIAGVPYNVDVVNEAGVDVASIDSWDDFTKACERIKASGKTCIVSSAKSNDYPGNMMDWLLASAYSEDGEAALQSGTPDASGFEKAAAMVDEWRNKGFFNEDYSSATADDVAQALADGRAGFTFKQNIVLTTAWKFNPDANLGFMPIPSFDGKKFLYGGEGFPFGIAKNSSHVDAAKKYLSYLAQPENVKKMAEAFGTMPGLTNSSADLGDLQASYDAFVLDNKLPVLPYFDRVALPNGMWNTLCTTGDGLISGQQDPTMAADQFKTQYTNLFGQNK